MECCRICLASNSLTNIFETEEIALNIIAIASVKVNENDGLPEFICSLCKHELDISISFKDKCESTFQMLQEKYSKKIIVKENIIFNLLSSGNTFDDRLPKGARERILKTVKDSLNQKDVLEDGEYVLEHGALTGEDDISEEGSVYEENTVYEHQYSNDDQLQIEIRDSEDIENITDNNDQVTNQTNMDNQTITASHIDDEMTDCTENEFEILDSFLGNQDLMCIKCNFCFTNESCLLDHLKRIHSKTMIQCQICLLYLPTSKILYDHLKAKHDVSDEYKFEIRFDLQSNLNTHLCSTPDPQIFECDLCHLNFKVITQLENHIQEEHHQFTCEECNKIFNHYQSYRTHLNEHLNTGSYPNQIELLCSDCNRTFVSSEEWDAHMEFCGVKENIKEKKSLCTIFSEDSNVQTDRSDQLRIHKRIKPHICSVCQMAFHKRGSLEHHLLQHNNLIKLTKETYLSFE